MHIWIKYNINMAKTQNFSIERTILKRTLSYYTRQNNKFVFGNMCFYTFLNLCKKYFYKHS